MLVLSHKNKNKQTKVPEVRNVLRFHPSRANRSLVKGLNCLEHERFVAKKMGLGARRGKVPGARVAVARAGVPAYSDKPRE